MVDNSGEDVSVANHWQIPSTEFSNIWETLIYDTDVKQHLLNYASTCLRFAESNVDNSLITWNKVILLHGPPGMYEVSSFNSSSAVLLRIFQSPLFSPKVLKKGNQPPKMGKISVLCSFMGISVKYRGFVSCRWPDIPVKVCSSSLSISCFSGTGKTSLCKALAHKLSIRLSHKYCTASLLEVNSHSLFSKWFSESGKLVEKMFGKVRFLPQIFF